ncbi:TerD family protein [Methylobacter sp. YRD-M1]|uniref:TerD family protein n=1 Tax=Methylobacter sp. YRD-M1 TaxID=2911520 RepID=UPI002DD69015|nr:TerD family protein [Methylobacter sp. YRD-M1]
MSMPAISLEKGENINLSKEEPSLKNILIGSGWDVRASDQETFDLDVSLIMVGADGKASSERDLIFYNPAHLTSVCGSVRHTGDNRTGEGEGDDESILIHLDQVPAGKHRLVVCVSIYKALEKKQNFGQVLNAYMRVLNADTDQEIRRYDLTEDYSKYTAVIPGEIYRHQGDWKFKAIGTGLTGGLKEFVSMHGLSVG